MEELDDAKKNYQLFMGHKLCCAVQNRCIDKCYLEMMQMDATPETYAVITLD